MKGTSSIALSITAVGLGLLIAWVDSRPAWDDTGVTAGTVLLGAAVFGYFRPKRFWIWAMAVGAWIPLAGIILHHSLGSLLALAAALVGAGAGALARRALAPQSAK